MTENFRPTVLRNRALEALKGNWGMAATAGLIYLVICAIPILWFSSAVWVVYLFNWLVVAPIGVGSYFLFWDVLKGKEVNLRTMFEAFSQYGRYLTFLLLVFIYIFLWSLLLVVPGIVKAYSYAMTPYILVDRPDLSANQAINLSCKMMSGHKFDLFYLQLSFIGWAILCLFTLGIGFLWLLPYYATAQAAFYQDVKSEYEMSGIGAGIAA